MENIEFYLQVAKEQSEFNRTDAAALLIGLEPNGEKVRFLRNVLDVEDRQSGGLGADGTLYDGFEEFTTKHLNPFISEDVESPFFDVKIANKENETFNAIFKDFKEILYQMDYLTQNEQDGRISREDLIKLAKLRGEVPDFLKTHTDKESKTLDRRKEKNLYLLVAILAEKAGYALGDRETTGKVKRQLDFKGILMSDDTIRKHLKEALKTLNDKPE